MRRAEMLSDKEMAVMFGGSRGSLYYEFTRVHHHLCAYQRLHRREHQCDDRKQSHPWEQCTPI